MPADALGEVLLPQRVRVAVLERRDGLPHELLVRMCHLLLPQVGRRTGLAAVAAWPGSNGAASLAGHAWVMIRTE
jgi:hypothetical protein